MDETTYRIKDVLDIMLEAPQNESEYGTSLTPTIEPSTVQSEISQAQAHPNSEEYNKLEPTKYREHRKTKQLQPPPSSPQLRHQYSYLQTLSHLNEQQSDDSFIEQVLQSDDIPCPGSQELPSGSMELAAEKVYPGEVSDKMGDEQQDVNVFQSRSEETTQQMFYKTKEEGYSDTDSVEQGFEMMSVNSSQLEHHGYNVLAEESSPKAVRGKEEDSETAKTRKKSIVCGEGIDDSYGRKRRKSVPTLVPMMKGTSPPVIAMPLSFDEKRKLPLKSESFRRNRRASVPVVISRGAQEHFLPPPGRYPLGDNLSAEDVRSTPTSPSEFGEDEESEEIRMPQIKVTRSGKRRLKWTTELSELFGKAVEKLGPGAVPSAILDEMGVQGLTRGNISSHLQKYRLEMRQMQLQKQAEEEHLHFNQFHFNHPEAFLDSQGKRPTKLQYPPLAAPSYHYQYDPLLHASDVYPPAPEDINSFMASTASTTENRCPSTSLSPTHIQTQPTSPTYHNALAHPYGISTSWEGSLPYPTGGVNYPYASYSPYSCTCACTPGSSTTVPTSSSVPHSEI